jgi:4'-phosphopantetheinyl transferase
MIDLWILPLAPMTSAADHSCLSAADWQRAARLKQAADRVAFVLARAALRRCLGDITGLSPTAVVIRDRPGAKPDLPDLPDLAAGLDVSFSRSEGLALVALGHGVRVGVDVEPVRPWDPQLATVALSEQELATVDALPADARARAFARAWTRKEALLKGLDLGLAVDPRALTVSMTADPVMITSGVVDLSNWAMRIPAVDPAWEAAVAVESAGRPVRLTVRTAATR